MLFGSFWHAFGYMNNQSNLESILKQENLTAETLLDTENVVNEIKALPSKFSAFLKKNSHITKQLIEYAITLPNQNETDEKKLFKYPFVASEILGAQIKGYEDIFFDINVEGDTNKEDSDSEQDEEEQDDEDNEKKAETHEENENPKQTESTTHTEEGEAHTEEKAAPEEEKQNSETADQAQAADQQEKVDESEQDNSQKEAVVSQEEKQQTNTETTEEANKTFSKESSPLQKVKETVSSQTTPISENKKDAKPKILKFTGKELVKRILQFLDSSEPLNDTSAGYFLKIVNHLIASEKYTFFDLVEDKQAFLQQLVFHICSKSVVEVVLKLLTNVGSDAEPQNSNVNEQRQNLLQLLIAKFLSGNSLERESISYIFCEIISSHIQKDSYYKSTKFSPSLLASIIEGSVTENTFKVIVDPEVNSSSLSSAADILNLLVTYYNSRNRTKRQSDEDEICNVAEDEKVSFPSEPLFQTYISQIISIISGRQLIEPYQSSFGGEITPFGIGKLKLVELVGHIFKSENDNLVNFLMEQKIFSILMNLMIQFPWNNLLHIQIEKIILQGLIIAQESDLAERSLFGTEFNLLQFIKENTTTLTSRPGKVNKEIRNGYLGFLINLTKKINETSNCRLLDDLKQQPLWTDYNNTNFKSILATENQDLGGVNPRNRREVEDNKQEIDIQSIYAKFNNYFKNLKDEKDANDDKEKDAEGEQPEEDLNWHDDDKGEDNEEKETQEQVEKSQVEENDQVHHAAENQRVQVSNEEQSTKKLEEEEIASEYQAHQYWKVNSHYNIDSLMEDL